MALTRAELIAAGIEIPGSSSAESFIPTGNTAPTDGLYLEDVNRIGFATNSAGRLFIDSSGNIQHGVIPRFNVKSYGNVSKIPQIQSARVGESVFSLANFDIGFEGGGAIINLSKSRSTNPSAYRWLSSGQTVGQIVFQGDNGFGFTPGAAIVSSTDTASGVTAPNMVAGTSYKIYAVGTSDFTLVGASSNDVGTVFTATDSTTGSGEVVPADGTMPANIRLYTTPYGASAPSERLRITSAGLVGIGNSSPLNTLVVQGPSSDGTSSSNQVAEFTGPGRVNGWLVFVNDTNNNSGIQTRSADAFLINPNGGNVGIGTNAPGYPLEISSSVASGDNFVAAITNPNTTTSTPKASLVFQLAQSGGALKKAATITAFKTNTWGSNVSTSSALAVNTVNANVLSEAVRIDNLGRVGIGTTSPSYNLHIEGSTSSVTGRIKNTSANGICFWGAQELNGIGCNLGIAHSGYTALPILTSRGFVSAQSGTSGLVLNTEGADPILFGISSSEKARIDTSGRLLVGTSSASAETACVITGSRPGFPTGTGDLRLNLGQTPGTTTGLGLIRFTANNGSNVAADIFGRRDGGTWTPGSSHPGALVFSTTANGASSPTERMRITSSGHTYWNSSSPGSASFGTSIGRIALGLFETYRNIDGTSSVVVAGGSAGYARIMGDGDLENTNNRYTAISDVKLKQNIEDASSQWDDIKAIQIRKYEFIANPDRKHIGVVAQELEQVCPGLVIERILDEGTGETVKSVAYSVLYMKAVKALQEAMERIETLEAKVAALESA